ncbi:MAG: DUF1566 domain-containing protein [Methylococcaceae bacterium]
MKKVIVVLLVLVVTVVFAFAGEKARDGSLIAYDNGTVLDQDQNLMWAAKDNGSDINWQGAKRYCESYRGGGYKDWRMPTLRELASLYNMNKSYPINKHDYVHLSKFITLSDGFIWASDTQTKGKGPEAANLYFVNNGKYSSLQSGASHYRALPVRSVK